MTTTKNRTRSDAVLAGIHLLRAADIGELAELKAELKATFFRLYAIAEEIDHTKLAQGLWDREWNAMLAVYDYVEETKRIARQK